MNKALKIILIISITIFNIGLLADSTQAQVDELVVEFEETPLFNEASFLPGDTVTRWVKVTNNSEEIQLITTEAINYPGFPNSNNVSTDDLSRVLLITIREKGSDDLYGGSTGEKSLFNFYEDGETYLSNISAGNFKEYEFGITFPTEKENGWQEKTTYFDILIGFQGQEGGGNGGGGNGGGDNGGGDNGGGDNGGNGGNGGGGGGGIPPGLTILNESSFDVATTSVTINWQTNYPATSWVIYAIEGESYGLDLSEPNYGYPHAAPEPEDPNKVTNHSVTITGLAPGFTYYYRCVSHASLAVSTEHSFTTLGTKTKEETIEGGEEEKIIIEGETEEGIGEEEGKGIVKTEEGGGIGEDMGVGEGGEKEIVTEVKEGQGLDLTRSLAAIGGFLNSENFWWILLLFLIILIVLFFLSRKRKKKK